MYVVGVRSYVFLSFGMHREMSSMFVDSASKIGYRCNFPIVHRAEGAAHTLSVALGKEEERRRVAVIFFSRCLFSFQNIRWIICREKTLIFVLVSTV